jgi:hypothetical protein
LFSKKADVKKFSINIPTRIFGFIERDIHKNKSMFDPDVKRALEEYKCAVNRYNSVDLSNPKEENVYYLERQLAYMGLQLALAKARLREGLEPVLDSNSLDALLKVVQSVAK